MLRHTGKTVPDPFVRDVGTPVEELEGGLLAPEDRGGVRSTTVEVFAARRT